MAEQLSWEEWQTKANSAYVKGQYGAQQMIADWGYPAGMTAEGYKIEFDKGKVKRKNREGRRAQRARANSLRALRAQTKGEVEAADLAVKTRQARTQSQSTLHRQTYGNKPSIVEHDVALQAGGSNTYTSISDPEFKQHKDDVEAAVYQKFGKDKVVVDIDDVSGETRVIPKQSHNKFQRTSQQPGVDIPQGMDIQAGLDQIQNLLNKINKPISRFGQVVTDLKNISQQAVDVKAQRMMDPTKRMPIDPKLTGPGGLARQAVKEIAEEAISVGGQALINQLTGAIPAPRSKKRF